MKKVAVVTFAVLMLISLTLTVPASAERKIYIDGKKISKIEEKAPFLGVYMDDLTKKSIRKNNYPEDYGVLLLEIMEDSPAERAGLKKDDIIYEFDGKKVEDVEGLAGLVRNKEPGDRVTIVFYRDGEKMKAEVELDEKSKSYITIDDSGNDIYVERLSKLGDIGKGFGYLYQDNPFRTRGVLGVHVSDIDENLAEYFDVKSGGGVLVIKVEEDSPASKAGILGGDVITEVDGEKISEAADLLESLEDMDKADTVEVGIVRHGKKETVKVECDDMDLARQFDYQIFSINDDSWTNSRSFGIPKLNKQRIHRIEEDQFDDYVKKLEKKLKLLEKRLDQLEDKD